MPKRRLLLLVPIAGFLAARLLVAGYYGCGRTPQPEVTPTAGTPAPEATPRKPMTEKERHLIGKWKLVKITPPFNPDYEATDEFRPDGTFTLWMKSPLRPRERVMTGTYRVQGDLLLRTWDTGRPAHNLLIESITEDRLVYSGAVEGSDQQVYDLVRVRD